ncbi:hypothetical protein ACHHYP_13926 [Achlya hypogyna]|uniref:Uncharacterized protein n=1 Tax=Achlya hypogyna TaxID=1202772 RepID=A0A1V9YEF3_ACHHY|nr:hypothetical protein ACHHYP_13926 [Achlya hypogyna]
MDPAAVLLTDLATLTPLTTRNVEAVVAVSAAAHKLGTAGLLCVRELEWGSVHDIGPDEWDTVLCSDCLYDASVFAAFSATLCDVVGAKGTALIAYKQRIPERETSFLQELSEVFAIRVHSANGQTPWNYAQDNVFILELRKRR